MEIIMEKILKRIVTWMVTLALLVTLVPVINGHGAEKVYADENHGECGLNAVWSYDSMSKVLTISGSGSISNHSFSSLPFQSVVIENGITGINNEIFRNSSSLEYVSLPQSIEAIGEFTFENCQRLKSISVNDDNAKYCSVDGVLYSKDMKTIFVYPADRESVEFTIPEGVENFGDYAFDYNNHLEKVVIPKTLHNMGSYAPFYNAKCIKEFVVDSENTAFGAKDGDLYDKNMTKLIKHAVGSNVNSVIIGDGVTTIGENAFVYSNSLEEVTLGTSVNSVEYEAFGNCENLTKITILNPECQLNNILYGEDFNTEITIYGYPGSTAESFAQTKNYTFVSLEEKAISSVEIASMPKKTVFALGDNYNSTGLTLKIQFEDGTSVIRSTGFTVDGFNSETLGKKEITVSFQGYSVNYEIEIVEELETVTPVIGEKTNVDIIEENQTYYLQFTPDKTAEYDFYALSTSDTYGAVFDTKGNLLAENSDRGDIENGSYVVDFYLTCTLEAGKTYLLAAKFENEDELGSFDVVIKIHGEEETEEPTTEPTVTPTEPSTSEPATEPVTSTNPNDPTTDAQENPTEKITKAPSETTKAQKVSVKKTTIKKVSKKRTSTKMKISLKKIKGITGYVVKVSSSAKFTKSKTVTKKVKKTVFTLNSKKIKNKKTLYVRVRCYKKVNGKIYYSSWTKKKVKIKK